MTQVLLDGNNLDIETFMRIVSGGVTIDLTPEAWERVQAGRNVVDAILERKEVVYGITTGFGNFATVVIPVEQTAQLQLNLIRSHSCGVGRPLPAARVRGMHLLRINTLSKGFSGLRVETLQRVIAAFNAGCVPLVPEQGTVGASGDLAPLSHLALGLLGEGEMWDSTTNSFIPAAGVLKSKGLIPLSLTAKEGLALINGTQMITALAAEAIHRAEILYKAANVTAAMTLESLKGTFNAFLPQIHAARPHTGQMATAKELLRLLREGDKGSEIWQSHRDCGRVQDSYTLRCIPQVHGIVWDTLRFVRGIIETEMNSATDNPMVFAESHTLVSGGNFHGEYPAKAMDYFAIGIHELANMSERRIERMVNVYLNDQELPAFLVKEGGLNSGFMIAHVTAAALVSENKTLCHPASVDSISTSAAKEDHVSMGGWASRKALQVIENCEYVVAIELLAAAQALEFCRPHRSTKPIEAVHALVRSVVAPYDQDRYMKPDIDAVAKLVREGKVGAAVAPFLTDF